MIKPIVKTFQFLTYVSVGGSKTELKLGEFVKKNEHQARVDLLEDELRQLESKLKKALES
jgi:hypothetical protein